MDFLLILVVGIVRKYKISIPRFALAAIAGALWALVPVLMTDIPSILLSPITYVGICLLMCKIAFPVKGGRQVLAAVAALYFITWLTGGILNFLYYQTGVGVFVRRLLYGGAQEISTYALLGFMAIACGGIIGASYIWNFLKRVKKSVYTVILEYRGNKVLLQALLDTGNHLVTPSGLPVSLVDNRTAKKLLDEDTVACIAACKGSGFIDTSAKVPILLIPFTSIGKEYGLLPAIKIDTMTIQKDTANITIKNPVIGFNDTVFSKDDYEMILHPGLV